MILKRINKLKTVGIFQDFEWPNPKSFQDFKSYNVIYGWNGSGKSTLTELVQGLEPEGEMPQRFRDSEFELFFSDDNGNEIVINKDNTDSAPLIRVFNEDFIEQHIKWEKIQAESIAFLGKGDADKKKEADRLKENRKSLNEEHDVNEKERDDIKKDISKWKKDNAKIIKDTLTTEGRSDKYANYDKSNINSRLKSTFNERSEDYTHLIKSEEELAKIKKAIHQTPKEKLSIAKLNITGISELYKSIRSFLQETVVSKAITELKEKPEIEKWVRDGFNIHIKNDLGICQFCNQEISNERVAKLEGHFSDTYNDFLRKLDSLKREVKNANINLKIPHVSEIDSTLQADFKTKLKEFEELEEKYEKICREQLNEIERKGNKLHETLEVEITFDQDLESDIQDIVYQINLIIEDHNQIVENFEEEVLRKKVAWEKSHIASSINELIKFERDLIETEKNLKEQQEKARKLSKKIDTLENEMSGDRQAAVVLDQYLGQYLGRDEIQVTYEEETKGFHFKRGDEKAANLSEGEKTGIALIYFLTKL
jgi:wobble nucleotide-excising tRNase